LLIVPFVAGLVPEVGCSPNQEYNSTDTVKTAPVALPPRPAKVNKPEPERKSASSKTSNL